MNFELTPGKLAISNIKGGDYIRVTSIELAILKKVGSVRQDPTVEGATTIHFDPERTQDVRTTLLEFMVTT